jgi:hypothetical protein
MNQYKIFKHPGGKIEAIKEGWSWPAFFFNSIWALVKKMWVLGGILCAVFFILGWISGVVNTRSGRAINALIWIGNFAVSVVFGLNGNSWRETNLESRGYKFKTTVIAATPEGAIAVFIGNEQEE